MELTTRPKQRRRGSVRGSVRRSVYEEQPEADEAADRSARAEDTTPPGQDEKAPGPDRPAAGAVASKEARETCLFVVADPGPPSKEAALIIDEFGHVRRSIQAESEEAASHWDARLWHPLR